MTVGNLLEDGAEGTAFGNYKAGRLLSWAECCWQMRWRRRKLFGFKLRNVFESEKTAGFKAIRKLVDICVLRPAPPDCFRLLFSLPFFFLSLGSEKLCIKFRIFIAPVETVSARFESKWRVYRTGSCPWRVFHWLPKVRFVAQLNSGLEWSRKGFKGSVLLPLPTPWKGKIISLF